jgi:hypothetical protein
VDTFEKHIFLLFDQSIRQWTVPVLYAHFKQSIHEYGVFAESREQTGKTKFDVTPFSTYSGVSTSIASFPGYHHIIVGLIYPPETAVTRR